MARGFGPRVGWMAWCALAVAASVVACGGGGGGKDEEDHRTPDSQDATGVTPGAQPGAAGTSGATGPAGPVGPSGEQGEKGDSGDKGEAGDQGEPGAKGDRGDKGDQGARGPADAVYLFDAKDQRIGLAHADSGGVIDTFLEDGMRALIDEASGALRAPDFAFLCLYASSDCTGACYVNDYRWLSLVVAGPGKSTWVARRGVAKASATPMTVGSYWHDEARCEVGGFQVDHPFPATAYAAGAGLTFPLAAPLYRARVSED